MVACHDDFSTGYGAFSVDVTSPLNQTIVKIFTTYGGTEAFFSSRLVFKVEGECAVSDVHVGNELTAPYGLGTSVIEYIHQADANCYVANNVPLSNGIVNDAPMSPILVFNIIGETKDVYLKMSTVGPIISSCTISGRFVPNLEPFGVQFAPAKRVSRPPSFALLSPEAIWFLAFYLFMYQPMIYTEVAPNSQAIIIDWDLNELNPIYFNGMDYLVFPNGDNPCVFDMSISVYYDNVLIPEWSKDLSAGTNSSTDLYLVYPFAFEPLTTIPYLNTTSQKLKIVADYTGSDYCSFSFAHVFLETYPENPPPMRFPNGVTGNVDTALNVTNAIESGTISDTRMYFKHVGNTTTLDNSTIHLLNITDPLDLVVNSMDYVVYAYNPDNNCDPITSLKINSTNGVQTLATNFTLIYTNMTGANISSRQHLVSYNFTQPVNLTESWLQLYFDLDVVGPENNCTYYSSVTLDFTTVGELVPVNALSSSDETLLECNQINLEYQNRFVSNNIGFSYSYGEGIDTVPVLNITYGATDLVYPFTIYSLSYVMKQAGLACISNSILFGVGDSEDPDFLLPGYQIPYSNSTCEHRIGYLDLDEPIVVNDAGSLPHIFANVTQYTAYICVSFMHLTYTTTPRLDPFAANVVGNITDISGIFGAPILDYTCDDMFHAALNHDNEYVGSIVYQSGMYMTVLNTSFTLLTLSGQGNIANLAYQVSYVHRQTGAPCDQPYSVTTTYNDTDILSLSNYPAYNIVRQCAFPKNGATGQRGYVYFDEPLNTDLHELKMVFATYDNLVVPHCDVYAMFSVDIQPYVLEKMTTLEQPEHDDLLDCTQMQQVYDNNNHDDWIRNILYVEGTGAESYDLVELADFSMDNKTTIYGLNYTLFNYGENCPAYSLVATWNNTIVHDLSINKTAGCNSIAGSGNLTFPFDFASNISEPVLRLTLVPQLNDTGCKYLLHVTYTTTYPIAPPFPGYENVLLEYFNYEYPGTGYACEEVWALAQLPAPDLTHGQLVRIDGRLAAEDSRMLMFGMIGDNYRLSGMRYTITARNRYTNAMCDSPITFLMVHDADRINQETPCSGNCLYSGTNGTRSEYVAFDTPIDTSDNPIYLLILVHSAYELHNGCYYYGLFAFDFEEPYVKDQLQVLTEPSETLLTCDNFETTATNYSAFINNFVVHRQNGDQDHEIVRLHTADQNITDDIYSISYSVKQVPLQGSGTCGDYSIAVFYDVDELENPIPVDELAMSAGSGCRSVTAKADFFNRTLNVKSSNLLFVIHPLSVDVDCDYMLHLNYTTSPRAILDLPAFSTETYTTAEEMPSFPTTCSLASTIARTNNATVQGRMVMKFARDITSDEELMDLLLLSSDVRIDSLNYAVVAQNYYDHSPCPYPFQLNVTQNSTDLYTALPSSVTTTYAEPANACAYSGPLASSASPIVFSPPLDIREHGNLSVHLDIGEHFGPGSLCEFIAVFQVDLHEPYRWNLPIIEFEPADDELIACEELYNVASDYSARPNNLIRWNGSNDETYRVIELNTTLPGNDIMMYSFSYSVQADGPGCPQSFYVNASYGDFPVHDVHSRIPFTPQCHQVVAQFDFMTPLNLSEHSFKLDLSTPSYDSGCTWYMHFNYSTSARPAHANNHITTPITIPENIEAENQTMYNCADIMRFGLDPTYTTDNFTGTLVKYPLELARSGDGAVHFVNISDGLRIKNVVFGIAMYDNYTAMPCEFVSTVSDYGSFNSSWEVTTASTTCFLSGTSLNSAERLTAYPALDSLVTDLVISAIPSIINGISNNCEAFGLFQLELKESYYDAPFLGLEDSDEQLMVCEDMEAVSLDYYARPRNFVRVQGRNSTEYTVLEATAAAYNITKFSYRVTAVGNECPSFNVSVALNGAELSDLKLSDVTGCGEKTTLYDLGYDLNLVSDVLTVKILPTTPTDDQCVYFFHPIFNVTRVDYTNGIYYPATLTQPHNVDSIVHGNCSTLFDNVMDKSTDYTGQIVRLNGKDSTNGLLSMVNITDHTRISALSFNLFSVVASTGEPCPSQFQWAILDNGVVRSVSNMTENDTMQCINSGRSTSRRLVSFKPSADTLTGPVEVQLDLSDYYGDANRCDYYGYFSFQLVNPFVPVRIDDILSSDFELLTCDRFVPVSSDFTYRINNAVHRPAYNEPYYDLIYVKPSTQTTNLVMYYITYRVTAIGSGCVPYSIKAYYGVDEEDNLIEKPEWGLDVGTGCRFKQVLNVGGLPLVDFTDGTDSPFMLELNVDERDADNGGCDYYLHLIYNPPV